MSLRVKRIIALCVCCLLLVAAIYQNVRNKGSEQVNGEVPSDEVIYVQDGNDSQEVGKDDGLDEDEATSADVDESMPENIATGIKCDNPLDYIAEMRIEREVSRSEITEECMAIIENASATESEKTSAKEEVSSISTMTELEDNLESVIKSRGYEDVFVMYDDEGTIDITVVAKNMTESEVNVIAGLVHDEAGVDCEYMSMSSVY